MTQPTDSKEASVPFRLLVLASGSTGNAAIVQYGDKGVLIDCGICKRDFMDRCAQEGFDPENITDVLITHEHSDHTKGLGVVLRGLATAGIHPQLHVSKAVQLASKPITQVVETGLCEQSSFVDGDSLNLAGMQVQVFATSHDSTESYGFRVEADGRALGFMTDTGVVLGGAHEALLDADVLALESNHDLAMLHEGPYPYWLKQRVESNVGHLSNVQAAEELQTLLNPRLHDVVAMHISQNNNTFGIPVRTLQHTIALEGHGASVQAGLASGPVSVVI